MTTKTPLNYLTTALTATALTSALSFGQSEEIESAYQLSPFTVSSDSIIDTLHITDRDLSLRQPSDLKDTLSIDPSITVGGSTGVAQKIYVRNLGEGLLNISVDGSSQVGSLFHHTGRIAVEPELLKEVEVQSGIGSVTNGPGALGGGIRFVTKNPSDLLQDGQSIGGLIKLGYYDNTDGYKTSANAYGRFNDNWSGLVSFVSSEYEDIEDANGDKLLGSNAEQTTLMGKVVGEFDNGHYVDFKFERLEESGDKLQRPEWGYVSWNPIYPMENNRDTMTLGYAFDSTDLDWLNLKADLSYSNAEIVQDGRWGLYTGEIKGKQLSISNNQYINTHSLTYGIDYRDDTVSLIPPAGEVQENSDRGDVIGFFIQDQIQATENLEITLGLRYDEYSLTDWSQKTFNNSGFSPSIKASYKIAPSMTINASSASAYRGPEVNDAFLIGVSENADNLTAEKARNDEISFNYAKDGLNVSVGAFQHEIDDVITISVPWSKFFDNQGTLETDGIFVRTGYKTETWNISLLYNQADTTLNGMKAIRYAYGSVVSSIGDTWVFDAFAQVSNQIGIGWNARLVQGIDDIIASPDWAGVPDENTGLEYYTIDKNGYATHDFFISWNPNFSENLTFNFTIKNAFDKLYRSHGGIEDLEAIPGFEGVIGAYDSGRDFRLSATWIF